MNAHWLLAAGFAGMAVAIFFLGWSARIMRVEWRDDRKLRAAEARYEQRHTHRKGDPPALPVAGRLEVAEPGWLEASEPCLPKPPWRFAGESVQGWAAESAEYELLTQTAEGPAVGSLDWTVQRLAEIRADERAAESVEGDPITGERPIDTGEIMAITDRVEAWISKWNAQSNYDQHTIQGG